MKTLSNSDKELAFNLCNSGIEHFKTLKIMEAISCLEKAISIAPMYPAFYWYLSLSYAANREYTKALSLWKIVPQTCIKTFMEMSINCEQYCIGGIIEVQTKISERKTLDQYQELIKLLVQESPGFMQCNIKRTIKNSDPHLVGYAVWELEVAGMIRKEKKGRSFQLYNI